MSVRTTSAKSPSVASDELMGKIAIHKNTDQNYIVITEDKVRICLLQHLRDFERHNAWIAPLGILLALVTTFLTSSFNKFFFDAATWRAVFLISSGLTFLWLVYSIVCVGKSKGIEDMLKELKEGSIPEPDRGR